MNHDNYWKSILTRKMGRRGVLKAGLAAGAGVAGLTLGLAGCGDKASQQPAAPKEATGQPAKDTPKYGGTIRVLLGGNPVGFDPHATSSVNTFMPLSYVYSRLLAWNHGKGSRPLDFSPVTNGLAEKFEQPDETTLIFYLRKGVKFHNKPPVNGRELASDDVKYTFQRMQASQFPFKDRFAVIKAIDTLDKYTVKFSLSEPYASLLASLASPFAPIIAKEVETQFGDFKQPESATGTGPYMLDRYQASSSVVFKKHVDYFRKGLPYADEVHLLIMTDGSAIQTALRTGQIDAPYYWYSGLPPKTAELFRRSNPEFVFDKWVRPGAYYITFRTDQAPFNDVRVRRATSMAIDRQAWINTIFEGEGEQPVAFPRMLDPEWVLPRDKLGDAVKYISYNPTEAKKLLAEAGYPDGFRTILNPYSASAAQVPPEAELIVDMLAKVGIQAEIKMREYSAYISTVWPGNYEGIAYTTHSSAEDVDPLTYQYFIPGGTRNTGRVNDAKIIDLLEKQRKELNKEKRKQYVYDIQKIIADQCYHIYDPVPHHYIVYPPYLKNFAPHFSFDQAGIFQEVWIDRG